MKFKLFLSFVLLITLTGCGILEFPDDYPEDDYDPGYDEYADEQIDPETDPDFSASIFSQPNYRGRQQDYFLEDGQRHQLVRYVGWNLNDKVASIGLGRGVGIALFRDRDFEGPVAVYTSSTNRVDSDLRNFTSSIIIFDLESGGPLGAWIGRGTTNIFDDSFQGSVRFLPMPESGRDNEIRYRGIDSFNDRVEWVIVGPAPSNVIRDSKGSSYNRSNSGSRYSNRGYSRGGNNKVRLTVTIHEHENFHGRYVRLAGRRADKIFMMEDHNLYNQASSVTITESW